MITTTTVSNEIKARVNDKLTECIAKATAKYNRSFSMPHLVYRQLGTKAGTAMWSTNTIELNSDFLHNGNLEEMINQVVPHEFAHIVVGLVHRNGLPVYMIPTYGRRRRRLGPQPHGTEWKSVMRHCLGLDPDRTHSFNMDGVKIKGGSRNHTYTCACNQEFHLSNLLHKRIVNGQWRNCPKCKSIIWLKSAGKPEKITYRWEKQAEQRRQRMNSIFSLPNPATVVPTFVNVKPAIVQEQVPFSWDNVQVPRDL
jgi:SprT protein